MRRRAGVGAMKRVLPAGGWGLGGATAGAAAAALIGRPLAAADGRSAAGRAGAAARFDRVTGRAAPHNGAGGRGHRLIHKAAGGERAQEEHAVRHVAALRMEVVKGGDAGAGNWKVAHGHYEGREVRGIVL